MAMFSKRKNGEARPFPWWLLVVGFIGGVIVTVIVLQSRWQPVLSDDRIVSPGLELTATAIIEQATLAVGGANGELGTLEGNAYLTATAVIQQATQQAFATPPG